MYLSINSAEERFVRREELYTSDELFFTGTAAEITSIIEVDKRKIGSGIPGNITLKISEKYLKLVMGTDAKFNNWLTYYTI